MVKNIIYSNGCAFARLVVCGFISALISACGTLGDYQREMPLDIDDTWQQDLGDRDDTRIVQVEDFAQQFSDQTLDRVLAAVLTGNYQLQIFKAQVDAAAANARIDRGKLWPALTAAINGSRNAVDGLPDTDLFNWQGQVSWTVDIWGRNRDTSKAAWADFEAALADWQAARLSLAAAGMQAWFNFVAAEQQQALLAQNQASLKTTLKLVERRYNTGLASLLEVRLARTALASAQSNLLIAEQAKIQSMEQLKQLLGESANLFLDSFEASTDTERQLPSTAESLPVSLPADIIRRRPDLVAAERRLQARELDWLASRKAWLPSFSLTGSFGEQSDNFNNLFDNGLSVSNIAGNLLQPVFNAGELKAREKQVQAIMTAELFSYAETLFTAILEVNRLMEQELLLQKQLQAADMVREQATATESLASRDYRSGLAELDVFLDAQRTSIDAKTLFLRTQNDWLQNRVNLMLALGGSFEPLE